MSMMPEPKVRSSEAERKLSAYKYPDSPDSQPPEPTAYYIAVQRAGLLTRSPGKPRST
jgi:hypothetical protein